MWYFEIFVTIPIRCFGGWTGLGDFWFCRYYYNRNDLNFCAKIGWMHYISMYCIPTKEIHRWKRINTNALMYERFLLLSHDQARHGDQKHFFSISFLNEKSYLRKALRRNVIYVFYLYPNVTFEFLRIMSESGLNNDGKRMHKTSCHT